MVILSVPTAAPDDAFAVINPKAYAAWDDQLDRFDRLRAEMPVARIVSPGDVHEPFWLLTKFNDCMAVSKDNVTFLNAPRPSVFSTREGMAMVSAITGGSPNLVESLVQIDAPKHPKLRRLTQDWFSPKNLTTLESRIRAIAQAAIDTMFAAGPEVDFARVVSAPYPLHVVMQILGVPEDDEPRMLMLTQQMLGGRDEDLNQSALKTVAPERIIQIIAGAVRNFKDYFAGLAAQRRANPTGDLASVIANARVDGHPLTDRDTAGYYIITVTAGHDTTSAATAGAMLALAQDPEQFARVKADRSLLSGIVEEAIRWTTPVQHFMRTASADTEIGGQRIKAGDYIMINYVAANHDPARFPDPRRFDAGRPANRHLAFGAGAHQCLGLHLARMEMRILFETLLDRVDSIELAGEPKRIQSVFVGGLKSLPLRWNAA